MALQRAPGKQWTAEEDQKLAEAVGIHGEDTEKWKIIAQAVPGRTNKACRKRWKHSLHPSIKKTPWSEEEDALLIDLYSKHPGRWAMIATHIVGRTDDACAKRYREALDPTLKKDDWTREEDQRLLEGFHRHGVAWGKVGEELQRSGLSCRNRWRLLERRKKAAERGTTKSTKPPRSAVVGPSGTKGKKLVVEGDEDGSSNGGSDSEDGLVDPRESSEHDAQMDIDEPATNLASGQDAESHTKPPSRAHRPQLSLSHHDLHSAGHPGVNGSICTSELNTCKCGSGTHTEEAGVDLLGSLDWAQLFPYLQAELPDIFTDPPNLPSSHSQSTIAIASSLIPSNIPLHLNPSIVDIQDLRMALESSVRRISSTSDTDGGSHQRDSAGIDNDTVMNHSNVENTSGARGSETPRLSTITSSCCSSKKSVAPAILPQRSISSCCQKTASEVQPSLANLPALDVETAKLVFDYATFLLQHQQQRRENPQQASNTAAASHLSSHLSSALSTNDSGSFQQPTPQTLLNVIDKYQQQHISDPVRNPPALAPAFIPIAPLNSNTRGSSCNCPGKTVSQPPDVAPAFVPIPVHERTPSHEFRIGSFQNQNLSTLPYALQATSRGPDTMEIDLQASVVPQKSGCCSSKRTASGSNEVGFSSGPGNQTLNTSSIVQSGGPESENMLTRLPGYIPGCTCGCADGQNDGPCDCGCVGICLCGDASRGFASSSTSDFPSPMNTSPSDISTSESSMPLDLSALPPIASTISIPSLSSLPPEIQSLLPSVVPGCTCGCAAGTNSSDCSCGCVGVCRCGMGIDSMKTIVEQELGITGFNPEMLLPYIQGTPSQMNPSSFGNGNALSGQMAAHSITSMSFQPLQMGSHNPFGMSSRLPETSLINTSLSSSVHSLESQSSLIHSASPTSGFFYSPSIDSYGTPELHSSLHPHSCCCTSRRSPTAYENDEAIGFSNAISLLNPDPPIKPRRQSRSSLSIINIGPSSNSPKTPSSETRLSGQVAAPVPAYACGHPDCWNEGSDVIESHDEELLTERANVTYATSAELVDHRRSAHGSEEENSSGPGRGTGTGGAWLFRCALKGCGKGWKSINGMQYHLQLSKAHFQLAINAKKKESQDQLPDDILAMNFSAHSSTLDGQEEDLSDRELGTNGRSGGSLAKGAKLHACPHEGCGNVYKQASGLKYHIIHGHPNTQPLQLQHVPPALARKMGGPSG